MGARFSAPVQTGPGAHPASYTMGTGSFPGVKRPGRGVDRPPPSSAKVKERVELYLYSTYGPSWPVVRRNLLYSLAVLHKLLEPKRHFTLQMYFDGRDFDVRADFVGLCHERQPFTVHTVIKVNF